VAKCIKPIGELRAGQFNPEENRDTERRIDPVEEDPLVSLGRMMYEKTGHSTFSFWYGVVMRVDKFEGGEATVKVRVPEKDMIPEPKDFVPANVKNESHSVIDMHRDYTGKTATAPVIGQIVKVTIPPDNSLTTEGDLVELTDRHYFMPAKHTEEGLDVSAKAAVSTGEDPDASVAGASGDTVGSGEMDPSTQVPPIEETEETAVTTTVEDADPREFVDLIFHRVIPNGIRIVVEMGEDVLAASVEAAQSFAKQGAQAEYEREIDSAQYQAPRQVDKIILKGDFLNPERIRYVYFCEKKEE